MYEIEQKMPNVYSTLFLLKSRGYYRGIDCDNEKICEAKLIFLGDDLS